MKNHGLGVISWQRRRSSPMCGPDVCLCTSLGEAAIWTQMSSTLNKSLNHKWSGLLGSSMLFCLTLFIVQNIGKLWFSPQCITSSVLNPWRVLQERKTQIPWEIPSQTFWQAYFLAGVPLVSKTRKISASEFCMRRFITTKKLISH